MESILTSVKEGIGAGDAFDNIIIMHINTVFAILKRMGVGPKKGFRIEDDGNTWDEFIDDDSDSTLEAVKSYVTLKVQMVFDPPANGTLMEALKEAIKELEWSLNFEADAMADSEEV
jgi:hypothetical protein